MPMWAPEAAIQFSANEPRFYVRATTTSRRARAGLGGPIARDYNARMPTVSLKHNSYFDGHVQSIGFERHGRRATAGVIAPGTYHFGTEAPERMTIVSGLLLARPDGSPARGRASGS